ncbi:glycerol-3-phosphate dehydrogenase/oxidase [Mycobacterium sp. NPDC003449]
MVTSSSTLSPQYRRQAVASLGDKHFDVLVVGGGVVGCGVALDAATRGLSVALVESRDFGAGTSSRSSKLLHGGLRYLEMLDFGLVAEALSERGLIAEKLAPHLVRAIPFIYPLHHRGWERLYVGAGVGLYDAMASLRGNRGGIPWHRHLSRNRLKSVAPSLRIDALAGALMYYDAQVDDARHTMALARTAAAYGATVTTGTRLTALHHEGGAVRGATILDKSTNTDITVTAGCVVNATGVWSNEVTALCGQLPDPEVRMSKGIHLVVPKDRIASQSGIILRTEKSVLFVIPWNDHWLIGTTDTDWTLRKDHPAATAADIDYLLTRVNAVLRRPLDRADIVGVFAGLRPLVQGSSASTAKLSREHAVSHPLTGMVSVAGGKYTTYRVMARDALDEALKDIDTPAGPCCTAEVPLVGAVGFRAMSNAVDRLAADYGLPSQTIRSLLGRYGSETRDVLAPCIADPSLALPLDGAPDYLRAEVLFAATTEGARHLDDILARRTRISFDSADRGVTAAGAAAEVVAEVMGWSAREQSAEVDRYRERVRAELASQNVVDDVTAEAVRYGEPGDALVLPHAPR